MANKLSWFWEFDGKCGGGMAHIALDEESCWCFQVDEGLGIEFGC